LSPIHKGNVPDLGEITLRRPLFFPSCTRDNCWSKVKERDCKQPLKPL